MTHRGRPRKDGVKDPWFFFRVAIALSTYDRARSSGEKYEAGLEAAIDAVRRDLPGCSMSRTEMKRILAELRPESQDMTLLFEEADDATSPDGVKHQKAWTIRLGGMPKYARHNAKQELQAH
jgi:hypothetical protein